MSFKQSLAREGIKAPEQLDVISGRGNFVNIHPGNIHFRSLVSKFKLQYVASDKCDKPVFAKTIVRTIRDMGGRFLKEDDETRLWYDIGDKKALQKTRQALREGAPMVEKHLSQLKQQHAGFVLDCQTKDAMDALLLMKRGTR